jgi:putative transposase
VENLRWPNLRPFVLRRHAKSRRVPRERLKTGHVIVGLIVRLARDNPAWGYHRIQGALPNVDYHISGTTVGDVLKAYGIGLVPKRRLEAQTTRFSVSFSSS